VPGGTASPQCASLLDVTASPDPLPDDLDALRALVLAERARHAAEIAARDVEVARLQAMLQAMQRARFGQSSEKLDPAQLRLGLEDVETALAAAEAEAESRNPELKASRAAERRSERKELPAHLPRVEIIIEPEEKNCPCCGGALHVIGEDRAERLDVIPAQHRVLVTRRPKYGCRACEGAVLQAPAPPRLIESGLPTEATVAQILVSKYADHLPLYRQWQILARQRIEIDRSSLPLWVGRAAWTLKPLVTSMLESLKRSPKLFCDETRAPVLDPGRGRTKTGFLWAIARDDRPWGGADPPGVVYLYAPGRGSEHALRHLHGFRGILQVDGYAAYNALADPKRPGGPVTLAFCWAHFRRAFYEIAAGGNAPIASEALRRIAALYAIEERIRGQSADRRRALRQAESKPLVEDLRTWLFAQLPRVAQRAKIAEAIRYGFNHWDGLTQFLDDGRIEIDSNTVERSIRPIALNRKNALFAGSDEGGAHWGVIASLIETAKLNQVEPNAYLVDALTKLVNGWPASRIDELLPWAYAKPSRAVA
jgi:transposase